MSQQDIMFENINDSDLRESIMVFDEELENYLCNIPELIDAMLEQYVNVPETAHISLSFSDNGKKATLLFPVSFFEDYCFCTRKERDALLLKVVEQMQDKLRAAG